jgi:hypothetical protein
MRLRLQTDGAAIVRGFLSDQEFSRTAEMAGNAFAFLDGGGGDTSLRETWISVGTIWLTNFEHCVAPELARDLVTLLSREATRTLGLSHMVVNMCSIRRLTDWQRVLQWHTDYHGGGTHPYDPGDALIFDHLTLHRTQSLDRETVSRMSIECRVTRHPGYLTLVQASSRLPGKSPPQPRSPRAQQDVQ